MLTVRHPSRRLTFEESTASRLGWVTVGSRRRFSWCFYHASIGIGHLLETRPAWILTTGSGVSTSRRLERPHPTAAR